MQHFLQRLYSQNEIAQIRVRCDVGGTGGAVVAWPGHAKEGSLASRKWGIRGPRHKEGILFPWPL